jgi:hypothetical protein
MSDAEERLRWVIEALSDPSGLTVADVAARYDPKSWRDWNPDREVDFMRDGPHSSSRPFTIERLTPVSDTEATSVVVGADGKRWSVTCWTQEAPPHLITGGRTVPAPPEGITIRLAEPDDGSALGRLERRAPLRLGRDPLTLMTFDHGDDYFAPTRLMDEVTIYVAEVDGAIVGAYCGAVQPVLLDGAPKRLFLEHHVRIDPTTARGGVFWALCTFGRDRYARDTDSIAFYVSIDNHPVRKFVQGVPSWPVQPLRALIPCVAGSTGGDAGRVAGDADTAAVADILNDSNQRSALFVPYTVDSLAQRLGRDPAQYGWSDVRIIDGAAVVGVGKRLLTVTKECDGVQDTTHRALVLDHGFTPGHADEYRHLLLAQAATAAQRGATHLAVFTSDRSPSYDVVAELASDIEIFDFWTFDLQPPASLDNGFYVDPIYF